MIDLTLTDAAREYIQKKVSDAGALGLRLSIKKTGCSGFSYYPQIVKEAVATDLHMELAPQVILYVDSAWIDLLTGLQIDYVEEAKTGLKQKRLVFTNPKEASRCGCGESFHIE